VTLAKTSKQTAGSEKKDSYVRIEINAWPFFWTVVGAWIWFGVLRLAHIV
jgi:hypothetical protein